MHTPLSQENHLKTPIQSEGIMELHEKIFELALKRSFFFPSNEPYGSTAGFYDYGPVGVLIKHKIEVLWRRMFIKSRGFHEVETSLVTPEAVLEASGHVSSFRNKDKGRYTSRGEALQDAWGEVGWEA
jgi:glycyl-tRNA synthetase